MEPQNLPCPKCPKICHSRTELMSHLRSPQHRCTESEIQQLLRASGWWEDKQPMPDGTEKALDHFNASKRAQAGNAINVPMVYPDQKRTASAPAGWAKTLEGFVYEKLISQQHTIDTIEKRVLRGTVIANHATLTLVTFTKDIGELSNLQDKERSLEAKLSGYVTADPEYHTIAESLYETKEKIRTIKKDEGADVETDIKLEDWYSGDLGEEDTYYVEWQEKFMGKALIEAEQVMKSTPTQEIKI